jgi:hypothetical protein
VNNPAILTGVGVEEYKAHLRAGHARRRARCYAEAVEQATRFYELYERVNRDFLPDDPVYSVTRAGITPVGGNDYWTFLAVASRQYRFLEVIIGGEGTVSAAARAAIGISTAGTTSGGAQTPEKFNVNSGTSLFGTTSIVTTWSAQPTAPTNWALVWGFNSFGGFIDWKAAPGEEYQIFNQQVSFRNLAGTGVLSVTAIWEEL